MRPRGVGPILTISAITVGFYWKILLVKQFSMLLGYEGANQAYAWFTYCAASWRHSTFPIWDPFTFSGHAFAGEMQTGPFYPPYLVFLLAGFKHGTLSPQAYHYFYVVTHIVCAWLMYALVRELELGSFAGLVAGVCFSLGGFVVRLNEWPHLLESAIWLPLIFLLLLRALKAPPAMRALSWSALSGLALAMSILAGGLHVVIMQTIVAVSAAIFHAARSGGKTSAERGAPWKRATLVVTVCLLFALGGGAIQLFPSVEYSRQAFRFVGAEVPASQRIPYAYLGDNLWPQSIVGLVVADFAGSPSAGEYVNPYLGVFPIFLAIIGIAKRWQGPWVRYFTGLVFVTFLYSLGNLSLIHGLLYALVPFLSMAREAGRFMYLADFGLAVLAAYGADAVLSGMPHISWESLERAFRWGALVSAGALVYPLVLGRGDANAWISLSLLLVILSYALFRYLIGAPHRRWAKFLILAVMLFDLGAFDWSAANRIHTAANGTDQMERLHSSVGVANFLRSRPGVFRVEIKSDWAPNIGDAYGVETTGGTGVTLQTDYARIRSHPDLLNVRYIVRHAPAKDPGAIYEDSQWKVYENPAGYARAWLAHETLVERDSRKIFDLLDSASVDFHHVAIVTAPVALTPAPPEGSGERASVRRLSNTRLDIEVQARGEALLIVSELFYPGWQARVNGKPSPIVKVDGALRGIVVPSGESRVELHYAPASFYSGLALSITSFLAACVSVLLARTQAAN